MRAGSNLSNSLKKSSLLIQNSKHKSPVPNSKRVIKQRDLAELVHLRRELQKLTARFDEKRSRIEEMLRLGADFEPGRHWAWLKPLEAARLMLDE